MEKLLVLTDFSANARHAETAALDLSSKLSAQLALYYILPYAPLIPSDTAGPYVTETTELLFEDSKERLAQEADRLREVAVMTGNPAEIKGHHGEGNVGDIIADLTQAPEIKLVVMGGRSGGALAHLLMGSTTAAVMRKSHKPVLVVPAAASLTIPEKAVFATNFAAADMPAIDFLLKLARALHFQLEVIHVLRPGEVITEIGAEVAFRKFLAHRGLGCKQVFGEGLQPTLQHYCKENEADLLAMTHQHHSFVSRLFGHSESKAAIAQQQLAVLVFPSDFNNY